MKERPILFSTEMVQAIMDGRKTMTRREKGLSLINMTPSHYRYDGLDERDQTKHWFEVINADGTPTEEYRSAKCRYSQPGDILWVREKFRPLHNCETGEFVRMDFYADMPEKFHQQYPHTYKPSIHMPKAAARIYLQVEAVRVERLQDITKQDAIAEGIKPYETPDGMFWNCYLCDSKHGHIGGENLCGDYGECDSPIHSFQTLWKSIHGPESWEQNPWVWVITFKTLSTTGRPDHLNT